MRDLQNTTWTVAEVNGHLKENFDGYYWEFLVRSINCKDVNWQEKAQIIEFSEFIPLKTLLVEQLEKISKESVEQCQECSRYFDIDQEDGIFGDTENLRHFICSKCAHSLSAWDFYQNHLQI